MRHTNYQNEMHTKMQNPQSRVKRAISVVEKQNLIVHYNKLDVILATSNEKQDKPNRTISQGRSTVSLGINTPQKAPTSDTHPKSVAESLAEPKFSLDSCFGRCPS